ncbi:cation:proton antiporter [Actinomyces sp. 186855]|uniref:cation:proton antiporter domain-containing protein n=3 Tax=Actinomyces TaxID=1654 RepID=UPI0020172075|nr:cation:proton antiporter family protein [Actinomyces sp. 187325]MCL3778333.1 cation:proton antiporter [Actinomyces sp. AC-20-1]MCL3791413.1 cation:proton antiporter [Actinomyces sp. 186855]MCL3793562.1 cation:proton antiporter [Actinomyces sp. 217892]
MTPALYLLAVVVLGFAATLLHLPPLVGFLIAGFVIGSSNLPALPVVEVMGDVGVAILLFMIGLKLDLRILMRREVFGTAVTTMVLLTGLGSVVIGGLLLLGLQVDTVTPTGVLLLGFALSFSSTVVVIKLLEERDDTGSLYGRIAIGALVVQDIAAVVYMTFASERTPSPWGLALVLLWPGAKLLGLVLNRIDHREMRTLFGIAVALLPGYLLFDALGIDGGLGALVMGALMASHPAAKELSSSLFTIKELLLVGFFLSIGMDGVPGAGAFVLAGVLLVLVPLRAVVYTATVRALRMRRRTSALTGLAMTAYSEFALIVVAVAVDHEVLGHEWTAVVSLALALSFVLSAVVNRRPAALITWITHLIPRRPTSTLHPEERTLDLTGVQTVIFGMGRIGRATYARLYANGAHGVLGIDNDASKVDQLAAKGYNVLEADATDQEFWERLDAVHATKAVLAMPDPGANLHVVEWLGRTSFAGRVLAIARYDDEAEQLRARGVDVVINVYDGLGTSLAEAVEALDPDTHDQPVPPAGPPHVHQPAPEPATG